MRINLKNFIYLFALINMVIYHLPLYVYAIEHLEIYTLNGILTFISVLIALFTVTSFILFLLGTLLPIVVKPIAMIIMVTNSIAAYFVMTYHVILDKTMLSNVFNTKTSEALNLYDPTIFLYILFLGILPAFLLSKIEVIKVARLKLFLFGITTLVIGVFLMYLNASTWLWLDKNAKILGGISMPWSYSINAIRYKLDQLKKAKKEILLPIATIKNNEKMLVVLIIGESARAANFSLLGYEKETNPLLKKENIVALKNTKSASTYTTASIHAMLSYKGTSFDDYESLPNYLQRTGVDVMWRSNNWGQNKLNISSYIEVNELKNICEGEGCNYDEVLPSMLSEKINSSKKEKIFVVLHTSGSHGPTYYKKYPHSFENFKPTCKSVDLKTCTQEELVNAYDNTILYTDYVINKTIEELKNIKDRPSLLLYISDHGESLGEYGLYLHGTPYTIAPDVQKDIPFILWESPLLLEKKSLKVPYIKNLQSYGHENIFHTVLGAFDINSSIYNKKLDILNP